MGMGNMNRKDFLQRAQVHSEGPCQAFVPPTGDRGGTLGMHRPAGATGGAPGHPHSASGAAGPGQSCPRSEGACFPALRAQVKGFVCSVTLCWELCPPEGDTVY